MTHALYLQGADPDPVHPHGAAQGQQGDDDATQILHPQIDDAEHDNDDYDHDNDDDNHDNDNNDDNDNNGRGAMCSLSYADN